MKTVAVIGGGASGMLAALTAAESPENRVLMFERQQRVGRKLMATGNGRCNLTNTLAQVGSYHGADPTFAAPALAAFPPAAALSYFRALGLVTVEERGGRVYPLSNSANSVVDVLRFALERAGAELHLACPVRKIRRRDGGFALITDEDEYAADRLVAACGGAAGAKLGGVSDGYELLSALGHRRTKLYPALVQLVTAPEYPRALKGVRADAQVRLLRKGELLTQSTGEVQFTDNGVSGPAVFDISRCASVAGGELSVSADFMRMLDTQELVELLESRREGFPTLPAQELFTGMVHNRLGKMLIKYARIAPDLPMSELKDSQLRSAAEACKIFTLPIRGTEGFDNAQVTAGGLETSAFDPNTLESRLVKGLFVCGELLDVDGDCGGYNLQWAWASGRLAGRLGE